MENKNSQYVWKYQKKLRTGYTTGSCAAGAAKAAAWMLLGGREVFEVQLKTPKGVTLSLEVEKTTRSRGAVSCAVRKDSGDDPDVTNGVYVYAKVEKKEGKGIELKAGEGIGTVTRKGLEQKIGEPAINRVPRQMITDEAERVCASCGYEGGLAITVSIPEGRRLAPKTFNPRLGIEGGLSVLGTTGIVEPMSERAVIDTIYAEMKMRKSAGHKACYVVPGNYGSDFLREQLGYDGEAAVKCSNYIGETIDMAAGLEMKGLLFVGHAGKLLKLAAGVMNTHSRQADCRFEVLASHAAMAGAGRELARGIMDSATTAEALGFLEGQGLLRPVMDTVMERVERHLACRAGEGLKAGAVLFSPEYGILGATGNAEELSEEIRRGTYG